MSRTPSKFRAAVVMLLLIGSVVAATEIIPALRAPTDSASMWLERKSRLWRYRLGLSQPGMPDLAAFETRLASSKMRLGDPLFIRIFKQTSELEVWIKPRGASRYLLFANYPICRWSGYLGPKLREGDRQSPEGIYTVASNQLNPNSRWHRSFNLGYPNLFDRSYRRTGSFIMVHGGCSSIGCFAMTDDAVDELWRLVTATLKSHKRFPVHVFPFRMTDAALRRHGDHRWLKFWANLKPIHDAFEESGEIPAVSVCKRTYQVLPVSNSKGERRIVRKCPPRLQTARSDR